MWIHKYSNVVILKKVGTKEWSIFRAVDNIIYINNIIVNYNRNQLQT